MTAYKWSVMYLGKAMFIIPIYKVPVTIVYMLNVCVY